MRAFLDDASLVENDEATEFTFTLDGDRVFSDGSPIEAKDVVFSLQRIQGMEDAKPNFLLGGLTITEVDDKTIEFTSETPLLQLPAILANPALGIVNSDVVIENGGAIDQEKLHKACGRQGARSIAVPVPPRACICPDRPSSP